MIGNSIVITATAQSIYSVSAIDNNGCQNSATVQIKVSQCVSVTEQNDNEEGIYLSPNPAQSSIQINHNLINGFISVSILNNLGQLIKEADYYLSGKSTEIVIDDLPNGIYVLSFSRIDSNSINKTFIIQR